MVCHDGVWSCVRFVWRQSGLAISKGRQHGPSDQAALSLSEVGSAEVLALRTFVIEKARRHLRWSVPQAFTSADDTGAVQTNRQAPEP